MDNYIILEKSGRLGNAIFRYLFSILMSIKHNINKIDTNIDYIDINDYVYYNGLDSGNHDIETKNYDINFMKNYCSNNIDIVAFNTLGFIKDIIIFDNLKENEFINSQNGHGIYIKKTIKIDESNYKYYLFQTNDIKQHSFYIKGYYQFDYLYLKYKKEILEHIEKYRFEHYIETDTNHKYCINDIITDINLSDDKIYDTVIHIRLGDFNNRPDFIEFEYLKKLFNKIELSSDNKICIISDKLNNHTDNEYLNSIINYFNTRNIQINIEQNELLIDFNIMKQCKILICSMSTLCWTAAYFSKNIEKCYMPNYNFFELNDRNNTYFKTPIYKTILYDVKTTKLNKIKVNIITLKEFPQRLDNLTDFIMGLNMIGLKTDIFYGVNGNNLDISYIDKNTRQIVYENKIYYNKLNKNDIENIDIKYKKYYDIFKTIVDRKPLSNGELGCCISHLLLYEQLLEDSDYDHYLILEDDFTSSSNLNDIYNHLINIPDNYDFIHLSYADWYPFIKTNKVNEYYYSIVKRYFNRTTGYLISKTGAQKLLSYCDNIVSIPADDLICHSFLNNEDFKFYVPQTYLFKEQGIESVIGQIN